MGVCVCLRPFGVAQDKGLRFILRLRYASLSNREGWGSGQLRSLSEVEVSVFFRVFRG